ncbi:MAG: gliding motility-associated C-terminal domain-containing protein [Lewinellaceae bacterium]|nr:gliding motility-associated C-terminal domain-containing protein [Lewinellaceae bacterium]
MDEASGLQPAISAITGELCVELIPLVVDLFVSAPNCDNTASIGVIVSGGSAPYEIIWRPCVGGVQNSVVSNIADTILTLPLPEGCWEVCVTDLNGTGTEICQTLDISIPSLGATLAVVQSPTCNNGSDGSLRADVTIDGVLFPNPGPNYAFEWNTVPPRFTQTIDDIPAGGYSVTVTDLTTGCTQVAAGTLSQPSAITVALQITPSSCPGIADGTITAVASGGTPGVIGSEYIFQWEYAPNPPNPIFTDDSCLGNPCVLTGKLPGVYFVTITDANGCTYVHPVEIELPSAREFKIDTIGVVDPTCFGLSNGSILVEASANPDFTNPNYLFFWNPATGQQTNNGNASTLSGLPAGNYDVSVLELNSGCTAGATFVLNEPDLLVAAVTTQNSPSCQLQNNGSIVVSAMGGTGAYAYLWSSAPPATLPPLPNLQNLTPGTYTVTVSDINGCLDSLTIPLPLPNPPAITAVDSTSVVCGADGCLSVTAPTGVSFTWTTLAGAPVGTTPEVCNLTGDSYIVTVRDAQNCVTTDTLTLAPVTPLFLADSLLTQPTCNGGSDGSIAIDVQGGTPGYLYGWSSGQGSPVIFPIPAGAYTVTVTDSRGCTLEQAFVLANPPGIVIQYNNIVPVSCPGACDGQVTLVTYYNTVPPTPANFDFLWVDGSTDSVRTDLCTGYNIVTVRDPISGCFRIDSIFIGTPPAFAATFNNDSVSCFGDNDGRARITLTGGNGQPYSYLWSTGAAFPNVTNLEAGPITVTVTDNAGCTQVFTTTIEQPAQISITTPVGGLDNPNCFGSSDGEIQISVSNGTPGYMFSWAGSTGPLGTDSPILQNLAAGTYTVTVTDANGCTELQFFNLTDPPPVIGSYLPWEPILCNGEETTLFIDMITGGSGAPYQYSLDFGVYLDPGFPISMTGGEHYITYIDRTGCEQTDTIFVDEPQPITVTFNPDMVEIELGDSLQLIPLVTGATVADFVWTPAELLSNPDTLEPYTNTYQSQLYTLVVFDANGCSATGSIQINIDLNRNVYIPNVFLAGNTGGLNDHFNPNVGRGVETVNYMRIFDRWGSLLYERNSFYPNNNDFAEGWDGKHKGQFVLPGVYVYVIEVKFLDGRVLLYRGDVTVLR